MPTTERCPLRLIRKLTEVGTLLSAEKDDERLTERILESAMELTGADGGTLYLASDDDSLEFRILHTRSLGLRLGGTSGQSVGLPRIPLHDPDGTPNQRMVAACAALTGQTLNIPDAYRETRFDLSGTRAFDEKTGYRSISFLTVPMRDHEDQILGVLQVINAHREEGAEVVPFDEEDQLVVESLASQAAIAITKKQLIDDQGRLFESFVQLIAQAIDEKSPHTGEHCRRVPELTLMLADAAARTTAGPLATFEMEEESRYELEVAAWLHDCGKVTTPEHVVVKATKLQTLFDRIELVGTRFELLRRDAEIEYLRHRLVALEPPGNGGDSQETRRLAETLESLARERQFLEGVNLGSEGMAESHREMVRTIARRPWQDADGVDRELLTADEVENLTVSRGTLTGKERQLVNRHIISTIQMLESLPFPRHLQRVPEFAGGHHERMDGRGYPRGLTRDEMSVQARILGIADVFEALTASDRPYKPPLPISKALKILGRMKVDGHVDPDLFDVFIRERVYLAYARRFLPPEQVDHVDPTKIPGHPDAGSADTAA